MQKIYKYPRTYHLDGSGIQHGDEDLFVIPIVYLDAPLAMILRRKRKFFLITDYPDLV